MHSLVLTGYDDQMFDLGKAAEGGKRAYAARHGYDFECVRDYRPGTHPSWQKLRLLSERSEKYDRILWLDADSVVTNPYFPIPEIQTVFGASVDWCSPAGDEEKRFISAGNFVFNPRHEYAGTWLQECLKQDQYANFACWEQDSILLNMGRNQVFNEQVTRFPRERMNSVDPRSGGKRPWAPGDFLCHLTAISAGDKVPLAAHYDARHIDSIVPFVPGWWDPGPCADRRHIAFLYEFLLRFKPTRTIEVGTYSGCCSSAFVAAGVPDAHFCDIHLRDDFKSVVAGKGTIHSRPGKDVLRDEAVFDLVFLDAAHDLKSVEAELRSTLLKEPRVIVAHDIASTIAGFEHCEGPAYLWSELQRLGWTCVVDVKRRPSEKTDRGFLIATKDKDLSEKARQAYAVTCW